MSKPRIGDERWRTECISYKRWCDMARANGWQGEDDADGLRAHCEPEEAATYKVYTTRDEAVAAAGEWFKANPDDSAFGAIIIEHQVLEGAHDDAGNPTAGCRPTWEARLVLEVCADGDVLESLP